ncbi:MFS transporter, partial [Burkholderia multivorans]
LLLAPLAVLLRDRPAQAANAQADAEQSIGEAVREAFSHRGFWLLNAGFFACGFQLAFIATHLPAYLLDHGLPSRHAS